MAARLKEFGFSAINLDNLPDDAATASEKIRAAGEFDLLITIGGVSVGKKDIMHAVVENLGEKIFWAWRCPAIHSPPSQPLNFCAVQLSQKSAGVPIFFTAAVARCSLTIFRKPVPAAASFALKFRTIKLFCRNKMHRTRCIPPPNRVRAHFRHRPL